MNNLVNKLQKNSILIILQENSYTCVEINFKNLIYHVMLNHLYISSVVINFRLHFAIQGLILINISNTNNRK